MNVATSELNDHQQVEHYDPESKDGFEIEQYLDALAIQQQQQQQRLLEQQQQEQELRQHKAQGYASRSRPRRTPRTSLSSSTSSAFAAWARAQATGSAYLLGLGGAICILFLDGSSGAYSIILGLMIYMIEQRPFVHSGSPSSSAVGSFLPVSFSPSSALRPHSARSSLYLIAAIPCFLRAPNYSGGICLVSSALTYALAAVIDWHKQRSLKHKRPGSAASMSLEGSELNKGERRYVGGGGGGPSVTRTSIGRIMQGFR